MPKYTLSWISRWIVLGPRQWLVWVLVVSLVAALTVPMELSLPAQWVWPDERGWSGCVRVAWGVGYGDWAESSGRAACAWRVGWA